MAILIKGSAGGKHSWLRYTEKSAADTAMTSSTGAVPDRVRMLRAVLVAYSAAPTQTGVTVSLDSGVSSDYDTTLATGAADQRYFAYIPEEPIPLFPDDAIAVTAPAAGGVITSAITILLEDVS